MTKSPEEMAESMVMNLPEKTGKSLSQWLTVCKASKLAKHGELVKHLKADHGITHGYANLIAQKALSGDATQRDLVVAQYSGAKADLRPIYEAVVAAAKRLGNDVEVSPKKTCVSLRRSQQFALIQAATKSRVDVGINIKDEACTDRLEKFPGSMVSHRVRLTKKSDVDKELKAWLKKAYEAA